MATFIPREPTIETWLSYILKDVHLQYINKYTHAFLQEGLGEPEQIVRYLSGCISEKQYLIKLGKIRKLNMSLCHSRALILGVKKLNKGIELLFEINCLVTQLQNPRLTPKIDMARTRKIIKESLQWLKCKDSLFVVNFDKSSKQIQLLSELVKLEEQMFNWLKSLSISPTKALRYSNDIVCALQIKTFSELYGMRLSVLSYFINKIVLDTECAGRILEDISKKKESDKCQKRNKYERLGIVQKQTKSEMVDEKKDKKKNTKIIQPPTKRSYLEKVSLTQQKISSTEKTPNPIIAKNDDLNSIKMDFDDKKSNLTKTKDDNLKSLKIGFTDMKLHPFNIENDDLNNNNMYYENSNGDCMDSDITSSSEEERNEPTYKEGSNNIDSQKNTCTNLLSNVRANLHDTVSATSNAHIPAQAHATEINSDEEEDYDALYLTDEEKVAAKKRYIEKMKAKREAKREKEKMDKMEKMNLAQLKKEKEVQIEKKRLAIEEDARKNAVQRKLLQIGVCPQKYRWRRITNCRHLPCQRCHKIFTSGYRCAGGTHYVCDECVNYK
jgi:hypothetical protein